jgi:hypothetical protein
MLGKKMKIALAILASLIAGLWWYSGSLTGALLALVLWPAIIVLYAVALVIPQPPPDPHLVQQMEQLSWGICRDMNKHSVEFCEEEIKQMRKKIGVR